MPKRKRMRALGRLLAAFFICGLSLQAWGQPAEATKSFVSGAAESNHFMCDATGVANVAKKEDEVGRDALEAFLALPVTAQLKTIGEQRECCVGQAARLPRRSEATYARQF